MSQGLVSVLGGFTSAAVLVRRAGGRLLALVVALAVVASGLLAAEVLMVRRIVEEVTSGDSVSRSVVLFGLATSGRRVVQALVREIQIIGHERVSASVLSDVVDQASRVRFELLEDPSFRDSLSRSLNAPDRAWATVYGAVSVLTGLTSTAAVVAVLATIAPELVPLLILAGLVLVAISIVKGRMTYGVDYRDTSDDRERRYLESVLAARDAGREIRLFGSQALLLGRHDRLANARLGRVESVARRRMVADLFGTAGLAIVVVFVLVVVGRRAASGQLEVADAAAAAVAVQQLSSSLTALAMSLGALVSSASFVADLTAILEEPVSAPQQLDGQRGSSIDQLAATGLGYRYPGRDQPAVEAVSLHCDRGDVLAIVGSNGSGKSTLLKLLSGLYEPTDGSVEVIDGQGVSTAVDAELVDIVTAVFQDFARYELPLRDSLALGSRRSLSDDEMMNALARVGLGEVVGALPHGLDTRLGRLFADGSDLSVGEWQRLSLARAALSSAPFVLLDEPTSALDASAEAELFTQIGELFAGRGVVVVSHRFATLRSADHIVVLDHGTIVETGPHDELMALNGRYAASFRLQASQLVHGRAV